MFFTPLLETLPAWLWAALDLLAPPACVGCGLLGADWCLNCIDRTERISGKLCEVCGAPGALDSCVHCDEFFSAFQQARAYALYSEPFRRLVLHLKYTPDKALGDQVARIVAPAVRDFAQPAELAVPVPLSRTREASRGFNQVALFARPLARRLGIAFSSEALLRLRDTHSQVGLSGQQRQRNLVSAFQADPRGVRDKHVLLLDDVFTTGSTGNACARALTAAGARSVRLFTLARAVERIINLRT